MTIPRLAVPIAAIAGAVLAISTAGAATITVNESAVDVRISSGIISPADKGALVFFGGMRSPQGKARGHIMGYEDTPKGGWVPTSGTTIAFAFGSGARIVTQQPGNRVTRPGGADPLVGGTGPYLGATGTQVTRPAGKGVYQHVITYTLPPKGAKRTTFTDTVRYGTPDIVERGGPDGVGNNRNIGGPLTDANGQPDGYYQVNSVLEHVYSGGLYQWFVADGTFTFADGSTLHAVGPFQRATGSAPGVLAPSPRAVNQGTGRFKGMRGQVVIRTNDDGTSSCIFTLVKAA